MRNASNFRERFSYLFVKKDNKFMKKVNDMNGVLCNITL